MRSSMEVISLDDLGIVRMRGVEAVGFLQGQLSNDVAQLSAERSILAGYHNPQGRAMALLRLVRWDAGDFLAVVPRELAAVVASRLSKFILRAKVKISDESLLWRITGLVDMKPAAVGPEHTGVGPKHIAVGLEHTAVGVEHTAVGLEHTAVAPNQSGPWKLPSSVGAQFRDRGTVSVCVGDQPSRWLVISSIEAPASKLDHASGNRETWRRLDVASGQPQVYAATSGEFVAQMLNLDVLNAIAFDKGCYTGQEVIARAHYRGRVKRRMQRFISREACLLAPGDSGRLPDGRTFKVVDAAHLPDGRCDFLAVAPLAGAEGEDSQGTPSTPAPVTTPASPTAAALHADQVALPYSLPE